MLWIKLWDGGGNTVENTLMVANRFFNGAISHCAMKKAAPKSGFFWGGKSALKRFHRTPPR